MGARAVAEALVLTCSLRRRETKAPHMVAELGLPRTWDSLFNTASAQSLSPPPHHRVRGLPVILGQFARGLCKGVISSAQRPCRNFLLCDLGLTNSHNSCLFVLSLLGEMQALQSLGTYAR